MKKHKLFLFTIFLSLTLLLIPLPNQAAFDEGAFTVYYDDKVLETYYTPAVGNSVAVRFTPPADLFELSGVVLVVNSTNKEEVNITVLDSSLNPLLNLVNVSLGFGGGPTVNIDFPTGIVFTPENASEFYIVVQWVHADAPDLGVDTTSAAGRSYTYNGLSMMAYSSGNLMIRAKVDDIRAPQYEHVPMQFAIAGESLTISLEITDEFGVQSATLYYRQVGSNDTGSTSLTLTGNAKNGVWYGEIPAANITATGLEYYLWATDIAGNSLYCGNSTNPYLVTVFGQVYEVPMLVSYIAIIAICVAGVVFYIIIPVYEGAEPK